MDELTETKIKAIALTIKQTATETFNELLVYVDIFRNMKPKDQLKWVTKCEEEYKQKLPKENEVPDLYEIGLAYLRWQVYLDLYTNGFEINQNQ